MHEMNRKSMETQKEDRTGELTSAVVSRREGKSKSDKESNGKHIDRHTYASSLTSNSSTNSQLIQDTDSCKSIDYSMDAGDASRVNPASSKVLDHVKSSSSYTVDATGQQFFNHKSSSGNVYHQNAADLYQYYNAQNSSHDFF